MRRRIHPVASGFFGRHPCVKPPSPTPRSGTHLPNALSVSSAAEAQWPLVRFKRCGVPALRALRSPLTSGLPPGRAAWGPQIVWEQESMHANVCTFLSLSRKHSPKGEMVQVLLASQGGQKLWLTKISVKCSIFAVIFNHCQFLALPLP